LQMQSKVKSIGVSGGKHRTVHMRESVNAGIQTSWKASGQECTPAQKVPPGGRCLTDAQCEFGECCPIYNFCRTECCTKAGGDTCGGSKCWPSNSMQVHCGAATKYSNCKSGHPSTVGFKCKANDPSRPYDQRPPEGLCTSFQITLDAFPEYSADQLSSWFGPVETLDLTDDRCECTKDVKTLFEAHQFVGYWAGDNFINACPGSGSTPSTPSAPAPVPAQAPAATTTSCTDSGNTGFIMNGSPASCAQLASYCTHWHYGADIRKACRLTCDACDQQLSSLEMFRRHHGQHQNKSNIELEQRTSLQAARDNMEHAALQKEPTAE